MSDPWSDNRVEGRGPKDARIVFVGEAPGETEDKHGMPFAGMAGKVLDGLLEEAGIKREEVYITNLAKHRPAGNNFANFTEAYLAQAKAELETELATISPNIIVALGEKAFSTLTGKHNITKWRGSILETPYGKLLPTIHPAAVLREWAFRPAVAVDFAKARVESTTRDVHRIRRNIRIMPTYDEVINTLTDIRDKRAKCAFDIETETAQISCISFATAPTEVISIPFWFSSSGSFWSQEQELTIWELIKSVLENAEIPKIAQNAQYDVTFLKDKYGITVRGLWLDTMIAFHCLYPELPKGLDFLCSIYTDVAYYKFLRKTDDMSKFFMYNALDSAVTYECAEKIFAELGSAGLTDFYYEHMHSLIEPLMEITRYGVRIDTAMKRKAVNTYRKSIERIQARLDRLVGHPLNINSPKQMQAWLYGELKLPKKHKLRKGKTEATITVDADTLEAFYKSTKNVALKMVLAIRERKKILSTYLEVVYDKEKNEAGEIVERARTSYLITGTETGRLSSRETIYGTGTNLQNVPKGIARRIFIPDDGKTFVNADLSQAEARVVAHLAGEDRLIRIFNNGGDIHRKNAANIFGKAEEAVTSEERELAKRVVHASNYGMGPVTFAKTAGIHVADAKRLLNQYFASYPKIKLWHMRTASDLKKTRKLTTPFGRTRMFFNRWEESLVKEALAYVPQSTVADLLNMGLRRLYAIYKETDVQILLQIHDAVLLQCPEADGLDTCKKVKDTLSIPFVVNNRSLVIPVDVAMGPSWDALVKVKLD